MLKILKLKKKPCYQLAGQLNVSILNINIWGFLNYQKNYFSLNKLYKKINNRKIDMTNFINKALKLNKLKILTKVYKSYWYEIDTEKDLNLADRELR